MCLNRWFDGLHFHDNHKAQIKQVQQIMLELYDECNDLDSGVSQRLALFSVSHGDARPSHT